MYSGTEPAVELKLLSAIETDSVFEVPLLSMPKGPVPVYDDQLHAVVGYRHETTTGVFRLYDLEGNYLGMEEVGIESPLLDPIDLIVLFGGLLRGVGKCIGMHSGARHEPRQHRHWRADPFRCGDGRDADGFPAPIVEKPEVHRDDSRAHGDAGASCPRAHSPPRPQVWPARP
jgi:hypothetical protein